MAAKNSHDWDKVRSDLVQAMKTGTPVKWSALAQFVNVDVGTLRSAALREWKVSHPRELLDSALVLDAPTKTGVDVKEEGNTLEIDYVSRSITSLDEALKVSKTDLSEWQVKDHVINFWPVGMKVKDADGNEKPLVIQLCQVKVWLIRKNLKSLWPMIAPVSVNVKPVKSAKKQKGVRRALLVADPQIGFRRRVGTAELSPFHDRRVLDIALQISHADSFDEMLWIGDCLDLSEWSTKWTPEPEFFWTTQPALIEWAWWLGQFSHIPDVKAWEGNHEKRMRDMIATYAKSAYGLRATDELELPPSLSVERLMAFHKLGVKYITGYPDNKLWLNRNVLIRHGDVVRAGPGDTAKAVVNKTTYTTIFGHVHRRELVSRRIEGREGFVIQTAFCPGCACHVDGRVPGSKSDDQWQQGIAVIDYTDDFESITPIPIENGRAIYNGRLFVARELDEEINTMLVKAVEGVK